MYRFDVLMYFYGIKQIPLRAIRTELSLRALVLKQAKECGVCWETLPEYGHTFNCTRCGFRMCTICILKLGLTEYNIKYILESYSHCWIQCPKCRAWNIFCLSAWVPIVWDLLSGRLIQFNFQQQHALHFWMGRYEKFHKAVSAVRKERQVMKEIIAKKSFKAGSIVRLSNLLDDHKDWNGRLVKIAGDRVIRNDKILWPVALNETTFLEQKHLTWESQDDTCCTL